MRLLIATDSFEPKIDGVSDTAGLVARQMAARGHDVVVVAPGPGSLRAGGARVVRLPSMPFPWYPELRGAYRFDQLARLIKAHRPEATLVLTVGPVGLQTMRLLPAESRVVHVYTTDMPAYLRAYRAPFLVPAMDRLLRWMGRRAAITLCPTEVIRTDLAGRGVGPLGIWGRGVDTALFNPQRRNEETRARLTGGDPSRPLVLFVGRLAREKRVLDLLEATRRLRHARFALVGDGPQRAELERLFPADRTVFTGYLRGAPLAEAFAAADVFAFPSDTDTFAQVVLQAMASAVPVAVAAETAPAGLVPDGIAGLHVEARSPSAFAAAIGSIIDDSPLHDRLSAGALRAVEGRSWDALVQALEARLLPMEDDADASVLRPAAG